MASRITQIAIDGAYDQLCAVAAAARSATDKYEHQPFKDALAVYSRAENQALSARIQSKLPRELRDMIYAQYWRNLCGSAFAGDEDPHPIMLRRARPWTMPCPSNPCECNLAWESNPHLILPDFVGHDTATEAAIAAYRTFDLCWFSGPEPEELREYLTVDYYHRGIVPGDYYRWLNVYIINKRMHPLVRQKDGTLVREEIRMFSRRGQEVLYDNLVALCRLKHKSRLYLKIQLDEMKPKKIETFLEIFRPVYLDLKNAGATIEIQGDVPPRAFQEMGSWIDISGYYGLPLEAWREKMKLFA
ncbi:hypothetical protein B0J11DRAFT_574540 [Dendryphion nanum]|uniref:Uncharacterized protein n=1 Tax=Dendryphion nanum TaxID=256645 RepID=A0A9P9EHY2_9PLEO|nr:hypothetical protein B0J11DRAFT_574540 [Dendryphion nanum]